MNGHAQAEGLRLALEDYLDTGQEPTGVPDDIVRSWRRVSQSGLDHRRFDVAYDGHLDDDQPLHRASVPVLDRLATDLAGSRASVLLSDKASHVSMRRVSDRMLNKRLDQISLAPGFRYDEVEVGTNAIGTALAQGEDSVVTGAEHYADELVDMACAASPIRDPGTGQVIGVIDLTTTAEDASELMLPLARQAARQIESRLLAFNGANTERAVLERFLRDRRRGGSALVALGPHVMVTSRAAAEILRPDDESALREHARSLMAVDGAALRVELTLDDGRVVTLRRDPVVGLDLPDSVVLRVARLGLPTSTEDVWEALTPMEKQVAKLVAEGLTNRQVGQSLFLSRHTVDFHLRSVYRKLGIASRVQLAALVARISSE